MKDTKDMNLAELAEKVRWLEYCVNGCVIEISDRLLELHELTRWIPVSERLPTKADADERGLVLVYEQENESPYRKYVNQALWDTLDEPDYFYTITHWQRITPPEDKP